jgi:glycosyltransferase involved in cell wall biosynthesis
MTMYDRSDAPPMSFLDKITVLILTYNEESNIGRTLEALARFPDVVILDSGSSDKTLSIAAQYPNTRVVTRAFDEHAVQWNYGLTSCGIGRPWVLALDADFVLPPALVEEIAKLADDGAINGYRVRFSYCMLGKNLSASLYPPLIALYRRQQTRYVQNGHTQRAVVDGAIKELYGRIVHDDRKPLSRWLVSQQKYAKLEADYLLKTPRERLSRNSRLRLMAWPAPPLVFIYTLIVKRCILDGWAGWVYVLQRLLAEIMIALELIDRRLRQHTPDHAAPTGTGSAAVIDGRRPLSRESARAGSNTAHVG